VLVVCEGNIARSPAAATILQARLPAGFEVASAGTRGLPEHPVWPPYAERLLAQGLDPDGHLSRPLDAQTVRSSDLILASTRAQCSVVVTNDPLALRKTFTLGGFARMLRALQDQGVALDDLPAVIAERGLLVPVHTDGDDIPDPYRAPAKVAEESWDLLTRACDDIVSGLAAVLGPTGQPTPLR
jgi:protein-tyrosine phosphatase